MATPTILFWKLILSGDCRVASVINQNRIGSLYAHTTGHPSVRPGCCQTFSEKVPHGRDIGIVIDKLDRDKTRIRLPPNQTLAGDPAGNFFFPGVLFSLVDSACDLAVLQTLNRFVPIATLDMRIDHLAPAPMSADLIKYSIFRLSDAWSATWLCRLSMVE